MKAGSVSYYMLQPPYCLTKGFKDNNKSKEKLFKHMRDFGAHKEWMIGIRAFS